MATVAGLPAACPARVERIAPGPQSATASASPVVTAAAEPAEATIPSASAWAGFAAGCAAGDASPAETAAAEVATTAGGRAETVAGPLAGGDAFTLGFALAAAPAGAGDEAGFAAGAARPTGEAADGLAVG